MSKIWKVLQWVIVVVLMVVGLALIFNEQIKSYVVNHMSQTAISKPVDTKTKHKGNFDFESVKAVAEVYTVLAGEIVEVNQAVIDDPELLNDDPHGEGWLVKIKLNAGDATINLMTADAYDDYVKSGEG